MRKNKILLVSDVDATAMVAGEGIPPQNIEAVRRFTRHGGYFTFASGRSIKLLRRVSDEFAVNAPLIALNGSIIYDPITNRCLQRFPLSGTVRDAARMLAAEWDGVAGVMVAGEENYYAITSSPKSYEISKAHVSLLPILRDLEEVKEDIFKILLVGATAEETLEIRHEMGRRLGAEYAVVQSGAHLVELMQPEVHKAAAVQTIAQMLGIPRENVVAAGDNENDLEMLRYAGFSAVPAGAIEIAKAEADLVLCDCMQGALCELIEHLEKQGTRM